MTLELNEDGEYEITECVSAEEGEGFIDSVILLCDEMDVDPEDFFEDLAVTDLTYVADLCKFMKAHPEYDHIESRGEMMTLDDLDVKLDDLFEAYLAMYAIDGTLTEAEAEDTAETAEAEVTKSFQLGTSSYTIEIPESYEEGELTEEDVKNDMVAYMKSAEHSMDFCVIRSLQR